MNNITEFSIIKTSYIEDKIKELEKERDEYYERSPSGDFDFQWDDKLELLKELQLQLKPLEKVIGDTFEKAREFNSLDGVVDIDIVVGFYSETKDLQGVYIDKEDYIKIKQIE